MGAYINPPDMPKEEWLEKYALPIPPPPDDIEKFIHVYHGGHADFHIICLVDNGGFTAAAIAFDSNELRDFAREDGRPKQWYIATEKSLLEVSDLANYLKEPVDES